MPPRLRAAGDQEPIRGQAGLRCLRFRVGRSGSGLSAAQFLATPDAGDGSFQCYASVYDVEYEVGGYFIRWLESISPGAFDASIASQAAVPVYYEHDWDAAPVGDSKPMSDDHGLKAAGGLYVDLGDYVQRIYRAMKADALREWSVAFWAEEILTSKDRPELDVIQRADLAEISVCVRGANPETETLQLNRRGILSLQPAGAGARERALAGLAERAAVSSHSTATSDSAWDGPGNEAKINADQLPGVGPKEWAWRDSSGDGKSKSDWKFPHHFVGSDGKPGAASTKGCTSIISSLNGGRGGSSIPDSDRSGVYAHAKKHLSDAGQSDIPELKSLDDIEAASRSEDLVHLIGMMRDPATRAYAREGLSSRLGTSSS